MTVGLHDSQTSRPDLVRIDPAKGRLKMRELWMDS